MRNSLCHYYDVLNVQSVRLLPTPFIRSCSPGGTAAPGGSRCAAVARSFETTVRWLASARRCRCFPLPVLVVVVVVAHSVGTTSMRMFSQGAALRGRRDRTSTRDR